MSASIGQGLARPAPPSAGLVGERRVTIVFDRGGWSPKLFATMIKEGFDVLTYRKGRMPSHQRAPVHPPTRRLGGRRVDFLLHDQPVSFLKGKLRLRQVTRLCDSGHQTQIITSRSDLRDIEIAWRMFERWRQENFFKYMRQEFLLDALVDYQVEPEEPTRTVGNPQRRALDKKIRVARVDLAKLAEVVRRTGASGGALFRVCRELQARSYFALTEHTMTPGVLIMSTQAWRSLSPADQNIFEMRHANRKYFARPREKLGGKFPQAIAGLRRDGHRNRSEAARSRIEGSQSEISDGFAVKTSCRVHPKRPIKFQPHLPGFDGSPQSAPTSAIGPIASIRGNAALRRFRREADIEPNRAYRKPSPAGAFSLRNIC